MKSKIIITIILFVFSIFYIKNAVYLVHEKDFLMKEIKMKQNKYNIQPIDAIITEHIMIPGVSGRKVNIEKSYNNMKRINEFKESLLVFDEIKPNKSINNIYNKVIIAKPKTNKISIITSLNNNYCYTENLIIKKECIQEKKYTILIYRITNNHLSKIKENLENGKVFYLNLDNSELNLINKYIKNNNYEIVSINELIKE